MPESAVTPPSPNFPSRFRDTHVARNQRLPAYANRQERNGGEGKILLDLGERRVEDSGEEKTQLPVTAQETHEKLDLDDPSMCAVLGS